MSRLFLLCCVLLVVSVSCYSDGSRHCNPDYFGLWSPGRFGQKHGENVEVAGTTAIRLETENAVYLPGVPVTLTLKGTVKGFLFRAMNSKRERVGDFIFPDDMAHVIYHGTDASDRKSGDCPELNVAGSRNPITHNNAMPKTDFTFQYVAPAGTTGFIEIDYVIVGKNMLNYYFPKSFLLLHIPSPEPPLAPTTVTMDPATPSTNTGGSSIVTLTWTIDDKAGKQYGWNIYTWVISDVYGEQPGAPTVHISADKAYTYTFDYLLHDQKYGFSISSVDYDTMLESQPVKADRYPVITPPKPVDPEFGN
jgi:hypothetical protein